MLGGYKPAPLLDLPIEMGGDGGGPPRPFIALFQAGEDREDEVVVW